MTSERPANLRTAASTASLVVACVLIVVKFAAWITTGSVAMLTSAIDALVDAGAALATFAGVRYARQPPDPDYRWGYGKAEALAALTQAVFLGGAALALALQAGQRLLRPAPLDDMAIGLLVAGVATLAAAGLVAMQSWVLRRTASVAIAADRTHYATDIVVNLAVMATFGLTLWTGWQRTDPTIALVIAVYMLWNARGIAAEALRQLMDRELGTAARERIKQTALGCPGVRAMHDLRTRDAGNRVFAEFHLEVDGDLPVSRAHAISDDTEKAVQALFPEGAEVTVHIEPAGIRDERLDDRVHQRDTAGE